MSAAAAAERVTLGDVAEAAGVSIATVSRALNQSNLIGDAQVERIVAVAERLGYRKRRIRRQAERAILTIKLLLPRRADPALHQFFDVVELVGGIRDGLAPTRANLVLEVLERDLDLFGHKKGGDLDGVIAAFCRPPSALYRELDERGVPCLTLNRSLRGRDYLTTDNRGGAHELAARVLAARPGARAAIVAVEGAADVIGERVRGLREGAAAAGAAIPDTAVHQVGDLAAIDAAFVRRLARSATVLCAVNDAVAIALLQSAREAGLAVPEQVAITGFDDAPARRLIRPAITTMAMPVAELARRAGAWIRDRVVERSEERVARALPARLVPGATAAVAEVAP